MNSRKPSGVSSDFVNRLDDVQMSAPDRERAKAMMRNAEAFADVAAGVHKGVCGVATRVMSGLTSFRLRLRWITRWGESTDKRSLSDASSCR